MSAISKIRILRSDLERKGFDTYFADETIGECLRNEVQHFIVSIDARHVEVEVQTSELFVAVNALKTDGLI